MLQFHDIRETRVYQEAKEEGLKEGREEGREEGMKEGVSIAMAKMAAKKMSAAEIAAILEVDVDMVHQVLAGANGG